MLVDRPTTRASWPVRALVWAAGVLGLGLIVLVVQQVLAEPAGADTPGLADGAVATVGGIVDPVSAALEPAVEAPTAEVAAEIPAPEAPAPVLDSPALEAVAPAGEATAPIVNATTAPVTAPLVEAVTPVVSPVVEAAAPVLAPVVEAVAPVVAPVVEAVAPVVAPLVEAIGPVIAPLLGTDLARSSSDDVGRPDAAFAEPWAPLAPRTTPPLVPSHWPTVGADGNAAVPVLWSSGGTAGKGAAASGVPAAPLAWPVPSAVPGGLGGPGSGGGGTSVLVAILAGGVPGLGLARGGVVRGRVARLTSLVHGPGRLPG